MATATLIDLSNYDSLLVTSSGSREDTPVPAVGNVYFDTTSGTIQFITKQTHAQVDLGSGLEDNPLDEILGIKFEAIYAFENQERAANEELRKYNRWTSGTFKFGGAYNFINSRKPSAAADRAIIRGSGWNEYASDDNVDRTYFGNKGLSNIESASQPYYQLVSFGAPTDFAKVGNIDEAVQVYGKSDNSPADTGAGDFDLTTYEAVSVRTFGQTYDRKETTNDLGITELGGYSTGFAVNEGVHLTTGSYSLSNVHGGGEIAPWDEMILKKISPARNVDEFVEAAGDFSWILTNSGTGNLNQLVAKLDALAQDSANIDEGDPLLTTTSGKQVNTWYTYNSAGKVLTRSGADSLGLYIEDVPTADQQGVVFTADDASTKTYSFAVSVEAEVGATAKGDANAWYHSFFAANYNTSSGITVEDSSSTEVKGLASTADGDNKIIFSFDYTGDTVGGDANTDKNCVFLCEGDGGATQAKTLYTITETTTVAFSCAPGVENNA